jgi:periplasmic copper chaperone A
MKRNWMGIAIALAGLAAAGPAIAHIVLAVREAPAGSYYKATFRVPHGCDGSPTVAISVELPPGIVVAKPAAKPGWTLEIEKERLARPVVNEGHELTERVRLVRWRGGRLPDDEYDEFSLMVRLPPQQGPLYFPVTQRCEKGETAWVQRPAEGAARPPHPAPAVLLTAPAGQD